MSSLPDQWTMSSLGGVSNDISYGFTSSSRVDANGPKLLRITDIQDSKVDWDTVPRCIDVPPASYLLSQGDIVIARTGATTGKSYLISDVDDDAVFASYLIRVRISGAADERYVWSFMQSNDYWSQIQTVSKGTAQPGANATILSELRVPLAPLPEQRRIVAKIDNLTAKSARARENLDHLPRLVEKYKQAILSAAFRGDLTREWCAHYPDPDLAWSTFRLKEVADIGTGSTPKRGERRFYENGHIPWITSGAVNASIVSTATEFITDVAVRETNCKVFPAGTLLVAMYGEGKTRGTVSVLGIAAATNQALAAVSVRDGGPAASSFVMWYLRSQYLELREQAAGGVQPNLNLGIIKELQLHLPIKAEQREIVRRIEIAFAWIDSLAAEATSARKLVDKLDHAILAKAFRGELVPQDPNDEPASVLLERIRAERAGSAPKKTRGRPSNSEPASELVEQIKGVLPATAIKRGRGRPRKPG